MQINVNNNTCFQSRNETIRFADKMMRQTKKNYPIVSPSFVHHYNNSYSFPSLERSLNSKCGQERDMREYLFTRAKTFEKLINALIVPLKILKVGNCGEYAQLLTITAKINGIENCYPVILESKYGKDFDHSVLYVEGKKPYIIDGWLGFTDYVPNAVSRYKNEFKKYLEDLKKDDEIVFVKQNNRYTKLLNQNFTAEKIRELRILYPKLICC